MVSIVFGSVYEETNLLRPWDLCTTLGAGEWKRLSDMIVSALWAIHFGEGDILFDGVLI